MEQDKKHIIMSASFTSEADYNEFTIAYQKLANSHNTNNADFRWMQTTQERIESVFVPALEATN